MGLTGKGWKPVAFSRSRPTTSLSPTWTPRSSADHPPTDPVEVLSAFPYALTTAEVAAVMAEHLGVPDLPAVEAALITATGEGRAVRRPAGDGSLWALARDLRASHM